MATNGWNHLLGEGLGAKLRTVGAALGIGGIIFKVGRQIVTKKDLEKAKKDLKGDIDKTLNETKKELKGEIDKTRNDIKDDYKNIATKEDIKNLLNELKLPK